MTTSPEGTWLWADDDIVAAWVRSILDAASIRWARAIVAGAEVLEGTDLGAGANATAACATLIDNDFYLVWHPLQPVERRPAVIFGARVLDNDT